MSSGKTQFDFDRLHQIGYKVRTCEMCLHSRWYGGKKSPWGICAKHSPHEGEPLKIHALGRCARGFKLDPAVAVKRGLGVLGEFL